MAVAVAVVVAVVVVVVVVVVIVAAVTDVATALDSALRQSNCKTVLQEGRTEPAKSNNSLYICQQSDKREVC